MEAEPDAEGEEVTLGLDVELWQRLAKDVGHEYQVCQKRASGELLIKEIIVVLKKPCNIVFQKKEKGEGGVGLKWGSHTEESSPYTSSTRRVHSSATYC